MLLSSFFHCRLVKQASHLPQPRLPARLHDPIFVCHTPLIFFWHYLQCSKPYRLISTFHCTYAYISRLTRCFVRCLGDFPLSEGPVRSRRCPDINNTWQKTKVLMLMNLSWRNKGVLEWHIYISDAVFSLRRRRHHIPPSPFRQPSNLSGEPTSESPMKESNSTKPEYPKSPVAL